MEPDDPPPRWKARAIVAAVLAFCLFLLAQVLIVRSLLHDPAADGRAPADEAPSSDFEAPLDAMRGMPTARDAEPKSSGTEDTAGRDADP